MHSNNQSGPEKSYVKLKPSNYFDELSSFKPKNLTNLNLIKDQKSCIHFSEPILTFNQRSTPYLETNIDPLISMGPYNKFSPIAFKGDINQFTILYVDPVPEDLNADDTYWYEDFCSSSTKSGDDERDGVTCLIKYPERHSLAKWYYLESYCEKYIDSYFGTEINSEKDFIKIEYMKDLALRGRKRKNISWLLLNPYLEIEGCPNLEGISYVVMYNLEYKPFSAKAISWTDSIYQECRRLNIPYYFRKDV